MAQYNFGVGNLFLVDSGNATPTPIKVGLLMDVSLDFSFTMKELRGQYQFPVDIARAGAKLSGKAKAGTISARLINSILTGSTITDGLLRVAIGVTGQVPAASTYTVTPTVPNSGTFVEDLGVRYADTGVYLTRTDTVDAAGEYSVANGVYTFYSGDASKNLIFDFVYSNASGGKKVTYTNQLMGSGAVYQLHLGNSFRSKDVYLKLHAVTFPKWGIGFKPEDYSESDFDFECFADASNNVATWSSVE